MLAPSPLTTPTIYPPCMSFINSTTPANEKGTDSLATWQWVSVALMTGWDCFCLSCWGGAAARTWNTKPRSHDFWWFPPFPSFSIFSSNGLSHKAARPGQKQILVQSQRTALHPLHPLHCGLSMMFHSVLQVDGIIRYGSIWYIHTASSRALWRYMEQRSTKRTWTNCVQCTYHRFEP